jgi:hypothetical protein
MQKVEIEWVDSCSDDGWMKSESERAQEHTVSHCTSIGYLYKKDKEKVCIVQNTSDTGSIGELMAIPRKCVKKITILEGKS